MPSFLRLQHCEAERGLMRAGSLHLGVQALKRDSAGIWKASSSSPPPTSYVSSVIHWVNLPCADLISWRTSCSRETFRQRGKHVGLRRLKLTPSGSHQARRMTVIHCNLNRSHDSDWRCNPVLLGMWRFCGRVTILTLNSLLQENRCTVGLIWVQCWYPKKLYYNFIL